jgi:hypothetical protein
MLENREDRLEYLTSRLLTDNPDVIVTSVTGSIKDSSHSVQMLTPGSIFSYEAKDLREALKDPELKQELLEVRDWIKTFIKSESGYSQASPEMKEAIEAVWRRNIESNFENLALFEKGGILNSLAGAFGEF